MTMSKFYYLEIILGRYLKHAYMKSKVINSYVLKILINT